MKIIGITGGVGSGKSKIIAYLAGRHDTAVIKADNIAHQLMKPGRICYRPVIDLLGTEIVGADQDLDRSKIAAMVYQDKDLLTALNKIVHPAVKAQIRQRIEEEKIRRRYFFLEAALLLEDHYDLICDEIWYVYAQYEIRQQRLMKSRRYSKEKIDRIMANQLAEEVFNQRCHIRIDNSKGFEETKQQIDARMQWLGGDSADRDCEFRNFIENSGLEGGKK